MKVLYVIGNGFDLWHGLPTSYGKFYEFVKETLDELEIYYSFDLHDYAPWHDFENALGAFCWKTFFDDHNEIDVMAEDFRPSFVYGLEDELIEQTDIHVETLKEAFTSWVSQIDISQARKIITFPDNSYFITFNYTSTLQLAYGIDNDKVFHIHGRADVNEDLIFGHGESMAPVSEIDEKGDSLRTIFSDAESNARYPLYALRKPVDEIIERNRSYFEQLLDITEIVVIGHSLNTIDLPYFRLIADSATSASWKVFCYTDEERIGHVEALTSCGIPLEKINMCTYSEL